MEQQGNALDQGAAKIAERERQELLARAVRERNEFEKALTDFLIAQNFDTKTGFPAGVLAKFFIASVANLMMATHGRDLALQIAARMAAANQSRIVTPDNAPGELVVPSR
jgi:hypothetical protein